MCVFRGPTGASSIVCRAQQAWSLCGGVWAALGLPVYAAPPGVGCSLFNPDTLARIIECGRANPEKC